MTQVIPVDAVDYIKELYPRLRPDDAAIERYRDAVDNLPPITIARGRILVDGYHRWQAHRRDGRDTIEAVDLGDISDTEIFNESISRNAEHGLQLSRDDKRNLAAKLWRSMEHLGPDRKAHIAGMLAVSERAVETWTKDARADEKKAAQAKAWDLWLDCTDAPDIAIALGHVGPGADSEERNAKSNTVRTWINDKRKSAEFVDPPESRQHFDVWQFHKADDAGAQSYFGALPPQIIENLLWLYTEPGDVVVDLFAGSGTTIDVAKTMGRRVWASDIRGDHYSPHLPIHKHDATTGWPDEAPNKAKLAILDPPYWQQAKGRYSDEPHELAELDIDGFYTAWDDVLTGCKGCAERVAYIISPTQLDDGTVIDHATDMLRAAWDIGYEVERRIIVTYQTQQATGQQVEWAREHRRLLKLYRDLVVLR